MELIYKNASEVIVADSLNTNLENCKIYIPSNLSIDILNLYVNDILIETKKTQTRSNGYSVYSILPSKFVKLDNGCYDVYIEGINVSDLAKIVFIKTKISLSFDEYNDTVLKYFSRFIGEEVSNKYDKIVKIANLCVDVYNSIKVKANE